MRQYFVNERLKENQVIELNNEISHHIRDVLRMQDNDQIRLVDSNQDGYLATITIAKKVQATIIKLDNNYTATDNEIILCAALIKRDKWEWLIQKASELGATKIVPLITDRTIVHLQEKEVISKIERWNKITLAACQQANRNDICQVTNPIKLKDIEVYKTEINLVAYEKESQRFVADCVTKQSITFIIGPEGGFTTNEIEMLTNFGFDSCSLGKRILRAETAALYFLSVIDSKRNCI